MRKGLITAGVFILGGFVAALMMTHDYHEADRMAFDGRVQGIEWKSQNHNLPLVLLQTTSGIAQVQNFRLHINAKLKIGDRFSKRAASHECAINGVVYVCVH